MSYKHIAIPSSGSKIGYSSEGKLLVPNNPIIPYIEGDGIGSDITPAMIDVVNYMVLLGAYVQDKDGSEPELDIAPNESLSHKVVKIPPGPTSTIFDDETKDLPSNTCMHHPV